MRPELCRGREVLDPVRCITLPNNHDFFIQSPYSAMVMGNLSAWSSLATALA